MIELNVKILRPYVHILYTFIPRFFLAKNIIYTTIVYLPARSHANSVLILVIV